MSNIASIPNPAPAVVSPAATLPTTSTPAAGVLSHLQPADPVQAALPATPAQPDAAAPASPDALQKQIDAVLAEANTSLRFRVDEQSQRVVVSVLDGGGEVVMQIPDEAALAVARHLATQGTLLSDKA